MPFTMVAAAALVIEEPLEPGNPVRMAVLLPIVITRPPSARNRAARLEGVRVIATADQPRKR